MPPSWQSLADLKRLYLGGKTARQLKGFSHFVSAAGGRVIFYGLIGERLLPCFDRLRAD